MKEGKSLKSFRILFFHDCEPQPEKALVGGETKLQTVQHGCPKKTRLYRQKCVKSHSTKATKKKLVIGKLEKETLERVEVIVVVPDSSITRTRSFFQQNRFQYFSLSLFLEVEKFGNSFF